MQIKQDKDGRIMCCRHDYDSASMQLLHVRKHQEKMYVLQHKPTCVHCLLVAQEDVLADGVAHCRTEGALDHHIAILR